VFALVLAGAGIWMWQASTQPPPAPFPVADGRLQALGAVPDFSLTERSGRTVTLADLRDKVWVADFIYTTCTDTCPLQTARLVKLQNEFTQEPDFRLVSISVDPAHDTVAVLRQYADRFAADRERWLFLTGSQSTIYALVRDGFKLDVEDVRNAMEATPKFPKPSKRAAPGKPSAEAPRSHRQDVSKFQFSIFNFQDWTSRHGALMVKSAEGIVSRLLSPAPALAHSNHAASPVIHSARCVLVDRRGEIRGYYLSDDEDAQARLRADLRVLLREPRS